MDTAQLDVPPIRTAPAADHPCELYAHHRPPIPIRTQFHHRKPVYLQNRLYGQIVYGPEFWVCGLCHDAIHEVIDWLLGEGRKPNPEPGVHMMHEARQTVAWYLAEKERLGK